MTPIIRALFGKGISVASQSPPCRTDIHGTAKSVRIGNRHGAGFAVDFDAGQTVPPHIKTHDCRDDCPIFKLQCTCEMRCDMDRDLHTIQRLARCDSLLKPLGRNRGDAFDRTENIDEWQSHSRDPYPASVRHRCRKRMPGSGASLRVRVHT